MPRRRQRPADRPQPGKASTCPSSDAICSKPPARSPCRSPCPNLARAAGASTLKFVPQAALAILDPVWTTATVTRNHAFLVFDTLFGQDASYKPRPQMAEGAVAENGGKGWTIKLRDGLMFHDGTKVLARDCVASIQRWGKNDAFGQALMAATDAITAPDDKTIKFAMKKPFALLPDALAKFTAYVPVIMPERLTAVAGTDKAMWKTGVGVFPPGTPMASEAGMAALTAPRDMEKDLIAAGYKGEKVVLLAVSDLPVLTAECQVGADMFRKMGFNLDEQVMDWGSVVARRAKKDPIDKGGWNVFLTCWSATDMFNPAGHLSLRGNGAAAWFGWPNRRRRP